MLGLHLPRPGLPGCTFKRVLVVQRFRGLGVSISRGAEGLRGLGV